MNGRLISMACIGAMLVAGCSKKPNDAATTETANAAAPAANAESGAPATPANSAAAPAFDKSKVPVSTAALGAFPYLSLPDGYTAASPKTFDMARYPVWVGDHFEWVEGKVYDARINSAEGKTYSSYEMQKNIEALVEQAGGVKITDTPPSAQAMDEVDKERSTFINSVNELSGGVAETFLIHQKDRDIWIQFASNDNNGGWAIIEAKPFVPTAKLLPATALKDAIDKTGKAIVHVNFDVDRATIRPDSRPQVGEVTRLMQAAPPLRLSIEGHTDNSGTPAHNRQLAEERAQAVVAALVAGGIARDRLAARGFGSDRPIDDNGTEAGRAQNRRVELVRMPSQRG